jgi:hypothetical protein
MKLELDPAGIEECGMADLGWTARRPRHSALTSRRAWLMPPLEVALDRYIDEAKVRERQPSGSEVSELLEA